MERLIAALNQNIVFKNRFDSRDADGEPDWHVYFFLKTGKRINIGIYNDSIYFRSGTMKYVYKGDFDLEIFKTFPEVENSTKFWNDKEMYMD